MPLHIGYDIRPEQRRCLIVDANQADMKYSCRFALAVIKGRISMNRQFTDRKSIACDIMYLSHDTGSFLKYKKLLAAVRRHEGHRAATEHPFAVAVQAEELKRFIDPA